MSTARSTRSPVIPRLSRAGADRSDHEFAGILSRVPVWPPTAHKARCAYWPRPARRPPPFRVRSPSLPWFCPQPHDGQNSPDPLRDRRASAASQARPRSQPRTHRLSVSDVCIRWFVSSLPPLLVRGLLVRALEEGMRAGPCSFLLRCLLLLLRQEGGALVLLGKIPAKLPAAASATNRGPCCCAGAGPPPARRGRDWRSARSAGRH